MSAKFTAHQPSSRRQRTFQPSCQNDLTFYLRALKRNQHFNLYWLILRS